jgi:hypothetical protein
MLENFELSVLDPEFNLETVIMQGSHYAMKILVQLFKQPYYYLSDFI